MITEIQNFRNKYPEYNDLDDLTLASKLASKYSEYSDLPDKVKQGSPSGRITNPPPEGVIRKSPPKWIEPVGAAIETVGLVGGAAVGSLGGPALSVGGAALGYAGAKGIYRKALELTGIEKPTGIGETTIQSGKDILLGGAMEAGGQVGGKIVAKGIEKIVSKLPGINKATTPEMQGVIDLAKRENVSVLAPDVTGNRTQALLFNASDKAIGGSGVTQKASMQTVQDMDAYANRIVANLGGEFDPTILGSVAREGMEVKFQPVKSFGKELYGIAAKEAAGTPTTLTKTTDLINKIRTDKEFQYLSGEVKATLNKVINDISPTIKTTMKERYGGMPQDIVEKLQKQGIATAKTMDFTEAESIRRAVSKVSDYLEITGNRGTKFSAKIIDALDEDMGQAAKKAGTLADEAYQTARNFQRTQVFGKFKGKTPTGQPSIGTRISKVGNEDFLKIISRGNITELQGLKEVLPEETLQYVKRGWLTDLFSKSQRILQTPEGKMYMTDTPKVAAELNKYGDKYLGTLFNKKEMKMLDDFRTLAKNIGFAEKTAGNPSGTAQTIYTIQLITGSGFAGYGAWKRDPIAAGTGLLFTFGGPYAIARFMTSPAGFRYMTSGVKESPVIKQIISNAIKAAAIAGTHANMEINQTKSEEEQQE